VQSINGAHNSSMVQFNTGISQWRCNPLLLQFSTGAIHYY